MQLVLIVEPVLLLPLQFQRKVLKMGSHQHPNRQDQLHLAWKELVLLNLVFQVLHMELDSPLPLDYQAMEMVTHQRNPTELHMMPIQP